ncbi:hypothetical protein GLOIN_2v1767110 [Rhizophagus irregularis DAOM 181602=DAOM 197198]|uniref:Uncharacterized protein n=1 Tax=Rhizophagus irregularis (strain DAOM 181602 / DAOM 197198 / MUCL 43194) TaxID=747089 RepID=A0A2P4QK82_RHIID|nr:hypothetical protein GLOIN_2v1767110 [Rhizophagus irregularis DAOM 181602=DAOM 197198]POG78044.1 hypothetical protein GLOIN_2v1767110 [Rhizophagus irregularis DAOM 181602=DAOM 197198]|eukprot:XP_025184910.1 hypothetical protein GLOIN_2v1767110 [Rhizophagus irregularis DAOM 181602=DAOM 197198]
MAPKLWIYLRQSKCQHSLSLSVPAAAAAPISYDRSPIPGQMPPAMPPGMAPRQSLEFEEKEEIDIGGLIIQRINFNFKGDITKYLEQNTLFLIKQSSDNRRNWR